MATTAKDAGLGLQERGSPASPPLEAPGKQAKAGGTVPWRAWVRPAKHILDYSKLAAARLISAARRMLTGRHVEAILVRSSNGVFLVGVEDMFVGRRLARNGEYSVAELNRLQSVMTEADTLLVIGAHIGALAVPASKCCRSVVAIEANPGTFHLLQQNLLLNGCHNVRALNIAASDKNEKLRFLVSRVNSGGSKRMPLVRKYAYFYDTPEVVLVEARRLDEVLSDSPIDIILMDIEGSEYFALDGMSRILSRARVLMMEFVPHHLRNVSAVSVDQLVSLIQPHFSTMFVPSLGITISSRDFGRVLRSMYDRKQQDDGIVFRK